MADKKISQLTGASTPLAGTEVLPIVQSGSTVKVASDDLTVKNVRSNSSTGILQVTGPATGQTRVMTVPNANFTVARTDASNSFTGDQEVVGGMKCGVINRAATYTAAATTPSVAGASYMEITNASATTITNFTGAVAGQILMLKFNDANTTINRSNAYLAGSANFTSANRATLVLIYDGAAWYEVCRTTNNG